MLFSDVTAHEGTLCCRCWVLTSPWRYYQRQPSEDLFFLSCNFVLSRLKPSSTTRTKCLVQAMAEILWRAGEEKQAVVTMYDMTAHKHARTHTHSRSFAQHTRFKLFSCLLKNTTEVPERTISHQLAATDPRECLKRYKAAHVHSTNNKSQGDSV